MGIPLLYDLACRGENRAWSPNCWKTRLALNYKGIDYSTKFLELPEIEPALQPLGISPNETGTAYTLPAMTFPDDTSVMDSRKIADEIEKTWPNNPSLHLDDPVVAKVEAMMPGLFAPLLGVFLPLVPKRILDDKSIPHFYQTRGPFFEKNFGKSIDEVEKEYQGEEPWILAKESWSEVVKLLKEKEGPYFLGETVSYADFYIVALIEAARAFEDENFERMLALDPVIKKQYQACAPWLKDNQ